MQKSLKFLNAIAAKTYITLECCPHIVLLINIVTLYDLGSLLYGEMRVELRLSVP